MAVAAVFAAVESACASIDPRPPSYQGLRALRTILRLKAEMYLSTVAGTMPLLALGTTTSTFSF